ncbi:MAG TPA: peptidylprolyl isomerase [Candidatus Kapabacteria bacterium]|nr:peptidylprolyl isomerase [Candidatus Kapabacteria bacterium]
MGTLQQIRRISPYVFGIFAFLLVAFFTIGDPTVIDGLRGASGGAGSQVLGVVNGEDILYVDYEKKVKEEEDNQRRQMAQQGQTTEIDNEAIRQRVWDAMVEEILLKQQLKAFGIIVSDKTIKEQMIDNPPDFLMKSFSDSTGKFNKTLYLELITNPENYSKYLGNVPAEQKQEAIASFRNDLINIEKYIRQNLQNQEIQTLVGSTQGIITPEFASLKYKNENSFANAEFIGVSLRDMPQTELKVTKEEIEKCYNDNKQYFKQKAARKLKYVAIQIKPSKDDSTKALKKINGITTALAAVSTDLEKDSIFEIKLNEYSGTTSEYKLVSDVDPQVMAFLANLPIKGIAGPINLPTGTVFYRLDDKRVGANEVVKAAHILIAANNNKDSAKAEAQKIYNEVKAGSEDFGVYAAKYSQDPGSARQGGDLGYFGKGKMVKEFEAAAFSTPVGSISMPIETQFGYHIIKVEDKKSEDLKYSEIKISVSVSSATRSQIFRDAKSIEQQAKQGTPLDSLASKLKYRFAESPFFLKNSPVLSSRYLASLAFNNEVGTILEPIELDKFGVVIAQVADAREAGISQLDDVRAEISQRLGKIKQLDGIKSKINELYNKVKNYPTLEAAVAADSTLKKYYRNLNDFKYSPSISEFGQDAAFAPKLFATAESKISEPFRGENGYYIVYVKSKSVPTDKEIKEKLGDYIQSLQIQTKNNAFYQWFQAIKENAKIEDYRSKFYKDF